MTDRFEKHISLPLDPDSALMLNVLYLIGEAIMRRDAVAVTHIIKGIAKMVYSEKGEATRAELRRIMELHIDAVQSVGGWYESAPDNWLDELKAAVFEVPEWWTPDRSDEETLP